MAAFAVLSWKTWMEVVPLPLPTKESGRLRLFRSGAGGDNNYAADGIFNEFDWRAQTETNGGYTLNRIPAGSQNITLYDNAGALTVISPNPAAVFVPNGGLATVNFLVAPRSGIVSGIKFLDLNGNGTQQLPLEVPLAGWTIYHDANSNGRLDPGEVSDVTDASGVYQLRVPGGVGQIIREVLPANWSVNSGRPEWVAAGSYYNLTITVGTTTAGINFGNDPVPFTVSGVKWDDESGNGVFDSSEVPLPGATIYIDVDNNGSLNAGDLSAVTGADGRYTISSGDLLGPGTYRVREVVAPAFDQTYPPGGSYQITASPGQAIARIDFGNRYKRAQVSGVVWSDLNADGIRQAGDLGLAGIFVYVDINGDGSAG